MLHIRWCFISADAEATLPGDVKNAQLSIWVWKQNPSGEKRRKMERVITKSCKVNNRVIKLRRKEKGLRANVQWCLVRQLPVQVGTLYLKVYISHFELAPLSSEGHHAGWQFPIKKEWIGNHVTLYLIIYNTRSKKQRKQLPSVSARSKKKKTTLSYSSWWMQYETKMHNKACTFSICFNTRCIAW